MNKRKPMFHFAFLAAVFGLWTSVTLAETPANEAFPKATDLWLRAAPPGAGMLAAYGTLTNDTDKTQVLTGAWAPDFGMAEIHKTVIVDGMARMRHQPEIVLKPGQTVQFKPGGLHIMLMQPKKDFQVGEKAKICLIYAPYEKGQSERVQHLWFPVKRQ